ncbi:MAG: hypothetical protein JWM55_329 [Acidimicrobiaceae bacterium]|nr:hypothetical protein [Acidimicrobiaceae bacterium]
MEGCRRFIALRPEQANGFLSYRSKNDVRLSTRLISGLRYWVGSLAQSVEARARPREVAEERYVPLAI